MPSHLTDIGFLINTEEEYLVLAQHAFEHGELFTMARGSYFRWSPGAGVELWGQLNSEHECIGLNPHFTGAGRMRVGLTVKLETPASSPLDGAFHGWAEPSSEDAESGWYPFVFDTPDFCRYESVEPPCIVEAQIAAFAHEVTAYASKEALSSANSKGEGLHLADIAFIPMGLFTTQLEAAEPPQALAILSGEVLETALRTNPFTQQEFRWARVQALGGVFDVVADPLVVTGEVVPGGILQGEFWLSGRLPTLAR
jgi:hypothetical protein